MIQLGELVMILDLHRQGLSVTAIARQLSLDRKTVRRYIARGLEPPAYTPRTPAPRTSPRPLHRLPARARRRLSRTDRLASLARAQGARLRGRLHRGHRYLRVIRPAVPAPFEVRFETPARPAGPGRLRPLRRLVCGRAGRDAHRLAVLDGAGPLPPVWARFVLHQDLQTSCAATSPPSRPWAACRWRSSTTA